ncbi:MAG: aldehyde dehydrogenase family protein [Methanoregulaceae archaeon]|jgi:succinate-semialdehyde dehydrogenase/glutarate-semialdehyde dehydrogenase|nr:aldehyde dehydrogenase family protein [Methanoregulaceae archaeon]MCU0628844.1 aldehyde dehydrogenase family protein [Methanoregulaceae archaeon]
MQMRIGGKEVSSADEKWIPVINPATGEEIDRVPEGTLYEVEDAVSSALIAYDGWAKRTTRERGMILFRAAGMVREQHKELARLLTTEQGKPLRDSVDEIRGYANILEFYAGISGALQGDFINLGSLGDALVRREPLGVCGAIIPWNMPAVIMGWKLAPALLAGNTMVFKPSSGAPLTCLSLAYLLERSGIPEGVLNVVTGKGEVVGEGIVRHPAVRKISFTGDRVTGDRVRKLAGSHLKDVSLELGGSDPMIVWKDADIGNAVAGAVRGRFYNAGQTCTAVKRLYVHHEIAKEFIARLKKRVEELKVGDGMDPAIDMGPLSGRSQLDRIISFVNTVERKGQGTILTGGDVLSGPAYGNGFFYAPTLVTDTVPECVLLEEEVFGPVLPIVPVPDLETAISKANSTRYGLGASIWTRDLSVVREVFSSVGAGVVWVNRHLTLPPEIPFGGVKESGMGRENGVSAYHAYTRTKSLFMSW